MKKPSWKLESASPGLTWGNDRKKLENLLREGKIKVDVFAKEQLALLIVHQSSCSIYRCRECDCDPEITQFDDRAGTAA